MFTATMNVSWIRFIFFGFLHGAPSFFVCRPWSDVYRFTQ